MKQTGFVHSFKTDAPSANVRALTRGVHPDDVERAHVLAAKRRLAIRLAFAQAA